MAVTTQRRGLNLLLMVVAIVLCLLAAFGIDSKLGISLFPLGTAFGFAAAIL